MPRLRPRTACSLADKKSTRDVYYCNKKRRQRHADYCIKRCDAPAIVYFCDAAACVGLNQPRCCSMVLLLLPLRASVDPVNVLPRASSRIELPRCCVPASDHRRARHDSLPRSLARRPISSPSSMHNRRRRRRDERSR